MAGSGRKTGTSESRGGLRGRRPVLGLGHEARTSLLGWVQQVLVASEAWRRRQPWRSSACVGAAALLAGLAAGVLLRLVLFAAVVGLLPLVGLAASAVIHLFPRADPVYTRAALGTLTEIRLHQFAVVGPLGDLLHQDAPMLFGPSTRAGVAVVRWIPEAGSAVLARLVVSFLTQGVILSIGTHVVLRGMRRSRPRLVVVGTGVQIAVALSVLSRPPNVEELETTGLSFAFNAILVRPDGRSASLTDLTQGMPAPLLEAVLVLGALVLVYTLAVSLAAFSRAGSRAFFWKAHAPDKATRVSRLAGLVPAAGLAFLITSCTSFAAGTETMLVPDAPFTVLNGPPLTEVQPQKAPQIVSSSVLPEANPPVRQGGQEDPTAEVPAATLAPSTVQVVGSGRSFTYLVNGQAQVIRGMGMNTQYAKQLSPEARAIQLDSDMAELHRLGVNTILGWDPAEFDGVTLSVAQQHGIGVVLPYEINPDTDFTDPTVRHALTADVLAWVQRYRNAPALRMWGLGNEVLHKIVHPSWVGPQDPLQERNAEAFANWLVDTADAIHAIDPNHPVTYRDAEDAFVPWVVTALQRHGNVSRPWFVYGTNVYQDYLSDIVDKWPGEGTGLALWVSEFAPGGEAIPDRPNGFRQMWGYIRSDPNWVLGGAVYAWTRNGPEEIDRNLGLTDDGTAVDGRSLNAIRKLFHAPE